LHELRHTAASLAIQAGANIKALQNMLGHESAGLTLDRDGHLYVVEMWPRAPIAMRWQRDELVLKLRF
jgi:integrase